MFTVEADISGSPVVSSGSVVVAETQQLKLFPFGVRGPYFLEFRFLSDASLALNIRNYNEGAGMVIELLNHKELTPLSVTSPIHVANHIDRKVMLQFAVQIVGNSPTVRSVNYTFFDGGAIT